MELDQAGRGRKGGQRCNAEEGLVDHNKNFGFYWMVNGEPLQSLNNDPITLAAVLGVEVKSKGGAGRASQEAIEVIQVIDDAGSGLGI